MTRSAWQVSVPAIGSRRSTVLRSADEVPGRDEVVEVLFRRHYPDLLRLAYCLLGDRAQAEDSVQDAFVSVYARWNTLRDPAAAPSYLRSAVMNSCRSTVRTRMRDRRNGRLRLVEESTGSSEEVAVARDEVARLARAVQRLPRRQREVVVCRYYLELTVAETAELLGITTGSVKRHAHRGVEALTARVGKDPT